MTQPKSCPFCGEIPTATADDGRNSCKWGFVVCGCGAQGPDVRTSYNEKPNAPWREAAIVAWNERKE